MGCVRWNDNNGFHTMPKIGLDSSAAMGEESSIELFIYIDLFTCCTLLLCLQSKAKASYDPLLKSSKSFNIINLEE